MCCQSKHYEISCQTCRVYCDVCRKRIQERRPTGGQKGVEHALLIEYKRGNYLTCNLQLQPEPSAQAKLLADLRESQADMEWWADAMEARINDIYQSTLLLIGKADQETGFHVDWTEAKNIAFCLQPSDCHLPWLLHKPNASMISMRLCICHVEFLHWPHTLHPCVPWEYLHAVSWFVCVQHMTMHAKPRRL